jgi:hypothetical protein
MLSKNGGLIAITHEDWDHINRINDYWSILAGYPQVSFICHKSAQEKVNTGHITGFIPFLFYRQ